MERISQGIKNMVVGTIFCSLPIILKSTGVLEQILFSETSDVANVEQINTLLNAMLNFIPFLGVLFILLGTMNFLFGFRDGFDGFGSSCTSMRNDDFKEKDNEEILNIENEEKEKLVSMDEMLLDYKSEFIKECEEKELEIEKQIQESNESKNIDNNNPFENDNNQEKVTFEKIQPKYETKPQMIKCSFCGRQKEMGGICKRCKTC